MLAPMLTPLASAFAGKPADIAWLVSAYAVSYAVLAPLIGLLSDRIGRRRLLLPALALFAADALAVAFAPSLAFAIVARILGGAAGAALTPTAFIAGCRPMSQPGCEETMRAAPRSPTNCWARFPGRRPRQLSAEIAWRPEHRGNRWRQIGIDCETI